MSNEICTHPDTYQNRGAEFCASCGAKVAAIPALPKHNHMTREFRFGTCPACDLMTDTLATKAANDDRTRPKLVPCQSDVVMTATGPLVHRCPHVDEIDKGRIEITWRCAGWTFELHSLADYLAKWRVSTISHEEITDRIAHDLGIKTGVEVLSVKTFWDTAGMEVQCCTSPTPPATP